MKSTIPSRSSQWQFHFHAGYSLIDPLRILLSTFSSSQIESADARMKTVVALSRFSGEGDGFRIDGNWRRRELAQCWGEGHSSNTTFVYTDSFEISVDHVAICVPAPDRDACLARMSELFGEDLTDRLEPIGSVNRTVNVSFTEIDGIGINIISPMQEIPHLKRFLTRFPSGGILHIGLVVDSMPAALAACRNAGIDSLADRLEPLLVSLSNEQYERFKLLVHHGFAEEATSTGSICQTFCFPDPACDGPFIELIARHRYTGYGETISGLLIDALDRVLGGPATSAKKPDGNHSKP